MKYSKFYSTYVFVLSLTSEAALSEDCCRRLLLVCILAHHVQPLDKSTITDVGIYNVSTSGRIYKISTCVRTCCISTYMRKYFISKVRKCSPS